MPVASRIATTVLTVASCVGVAVALHWRRQSQSSSQPEIDAMIAEITADLACVDVDDGTRVSVPFVARASSPPSSDRPFFWYVASTCPEHSFAGPINVVHEQHGWSPSLNAANDELFDAMTVEGMHGEPGDEEDDAA